MNCPACRTPNDDNASHCVSCRAELASPTIVVVTVDFAPGTVFHGRYEIQGLLGKGGMGMVYKAHDRTLDETVAIKVLRPDFAQDPKMAERFRSEIKLARKVRHKNVCGIHDYGEEQGLLFISMEYIEGADLKHLLREKGALPPEQAYDVAIQVSEGLAAVHDAGIIHRDLKTPNIIVDKQGLARLMDFGIAKRAGIEGGTLTATGHIVGTPEYMSPEQAQGGKVDSRSDIYALGIVVYELFTGNVPFRGETPISTILKHINDAPPLDSAALPAGLRPVLRRCLAKDPAGRYASSREVAEGLRQAHSPSRRQVPMATVALQAPTMKQPVPRRGFRPWYLAVAVAAVAAGILLWRGTGPAPSPTPLPVASATALPSLAPSPAPTPEASPSPTLEPTPRATPTARPTATPAARPSPTAVAVVPTPTPVPATPTPAPVREAEGAGQLQIAVKPWGDVIVDGKIVGTTPIDRVSLQPGSHVVRIRHPLYETWERTVTIRAGQTEKLVVDLNVDGVKKP